MKIFYGSFIFSDHVINSQPLQYSAKCMKTSTIECNGSLVDCDLCSMDCMQPHCQILIFNLFSRDIVINCSAGLQCTLHLLRTEQAPPLKSHQQLLTRVSNKLVPQEGRETQPIVKSVERTTHYAHHLKENLHNNFCSLIIKVLSTWNTP